MDGRPILTVERFHIISVKFEHPKLKFLIRQHDKLLESFVDVFELNDNQVGIIYRDNKISDILPSGSLMVTWKGAEDVRVNIVDITED